MMDEVWKEITRSLEKSLNPGLFTIWIKPLKAEVKGNLLLLKAPNEFVSAWVRDRLLGVIRDAAVQIMGFEPKVEIKACPDERETEDDNGSSVNAKSSNVVPMPRKQAGLPFGRLPLIGSIKKWRFSFDDFVTGPSNELACAASKGMCQDSLPSDHLFLSSGPGLGKTHLLHAIGQRMSVGCNHKKVRIAFLTAEEFATRWVLSIKANDVNRFKSEFRNNVDVLLLEDVHFFQGKEKMQDELLGTLKALRDRGCKVAFTSSFLPRELSDLDSKLVSRFCSGFTAVIQKPDFETRRRIVHFKAKALGAEVPSDVSELLAERISTDIRQLESCLTNMVHKAMLLNLQLSVDLAWEMLENYAHTNSSPDLDHIVEFVCRSFGLTQGQLSSKSRKQQIVLARNTAFYLARMHTDLSLANIGKRLGRKHSTVLKGITKVEQEISAQTPLGCQLERTMDRLSC